MTAKELTDEHRVALASAFLFELGLALARENPETVNNIPMQALARTWLAAFHGGPDHAIAIWNHLRAEHNADIDVMRRRTH